MLNNYKYKYLKSIILIFAVLLTYNMQAQNVSVPDSLIVRNDTKKGLIFNYKVKKGNTIYSIARRFKADLIDIYAFNQNLDLKNLSIGLEIIIPFDIQLLDNSHQKDAGEVHKVYYKVGKKENLFRIAKMYFGQDVDKVKRLNKLKGSTIQPGQILEIGSVVNPAIESINKEVENISKDKQKKVEPKKEIIVKDSIVKKDKEELKFDKVVEVKTDTLIENTKEIEEEKPEIMVSDSGMALWNKNIRTKGLFVLSNSARPNSLMEIYNPLVERKIFAKVLGGIPPNSYPDNVMLILSPQAADALGARNSRFFVRINFIKK